MINSLFKKTRYMAFDVLRWRIEHNSLFGQDLSLGNGRFDEDEGDGGNSYNH